MHNFQTFLLEHDAAIRLGCFMVLIILFMLLERMRPRRISEKSASNRRINNFALLGIDIIAVRLLVPLATYEVAVMTAEREAGLFNILQLPFIANVLLTIIIFDLLIYFQHVAFHKFNILWRSHRVHHTDIEIDVSTGIRFHPIEITLSLFYKLAAVYLLGPVAFAIVLYEIILNSASLFTHSNILINSKLDKILRTVFVTPDLHRIHHSVIKYETDSNYGNLFSVWDKLFRTYRKQPEAGYEKMELGLNEFRGELSNKLLQLLKIPFLVSR